MRRIPVSLFLLTGLFFLAGLTLVLLSTFNPAPRHTWKTYTGKLAGIEFKDTPKLGRMMIVNLTESPGESRFVLTHAQKHPGIEAYVASIEPGAEVSVDAVPREAAGWSAAEGQPLSLLVMRAKDEVVFDVERDEKRGRWLSMLLPIVGGLIALVSGSLLFKLIQLEWRARRSAPGADPA